MSNNKMKSGELRVNLQEEEILWYDRKRAFLGLPWSFTKYKLYESKITMEKGLFNRTEEEVKLYRIVDMSMDLPLSQRIFKCGTINLVSKDVSSPSTSLKQVKDPYKVHKILEESIAAQKKDYGVLGKDIYGVSSDFDEDHICDK